MINKKDALSFKPKEVTKKLLGTLADRAKDILTKRYGLGGELDRLTLESIGQEYGITRERVRQIENFALNAIRKSNDFTGTQPIFEELKEVMEYHGGIVHEDEFLSAVAKDDSTKNHIHFLLVVSDLFTKIKEDEEFFHRWTVNPKMADQVQKSIRNLCQALSVNDLISENSLVEDFLNELDKITVDLLVEPGEKETLAKKWLALSKSLDRNPLGEWGLTKSPNVRMRGIRDYAYLVLRENGSPMHFTEVSNQINKLFHKEAHPATCHNELIKDDRFVLVGRGLYALAEWGYSKGVVADVIRNILKKSGPLTKEEVINRVLKERHVKENTIIVNLQNPNLFKRDKSGKYSL